MNPSKTNYPLRIIFIHQVMASFVFMVWNSHSNNWCFCSAKARYQQYACKQVRCTNKCQTFCNCSPSQWMCRVCHPVHITCEITSNSSRDWIQFMVFSIQCKYSEVGFSQIYLCYNVRSFDNSNKHKKIFYNVFLIYSHVYWFIFYTYIIMYWIQYIDQYINQYR